MYELPADGSPAPAQAPAAPARIHYDALFIAKLLLHFDISCVDDSTDHIPYAYDTKSPYTLIQINS